MYSRMLVANDGSPADKRRSQGRSSWRGNSPPASYGDGRGAPALSSEYRRNRRGKDDANHRFAPVMGAANAEAKGAGAAIGTHLVPRPRRRRGHRADQTAESGPSRRRLHGPFAALRADHRRHHRSARPFGALRGAGGKITRSDLLDIPHQEGRGGNDAFDVLAIGSLVRPLPGRNVRDGLEGALLDLDGNFLAGFAVVRLEPLRP